MDSGNEIECPPRGESPYLHASLFVGYNYANFVFFIFLLL